MSDGYDSYKKLRDNGTSEYEMENLDRSHILESNLLGGFDFLSESDASDIRRNSAKYEVQYQYEIGLEQEREFERQRYLEEQREEEERRREYERELKKEQERLEEEELRNWSHKQAEYALHKMKENYKRDQNALNDEYASPYDRARALRNQQMQSSSYLQEEINNIKQEEKDKKRPFEKWIYIIIIAIIILICLKII